MSLSNRLILLFKTILGCHFSTRLLMLRTNQSKFEEPYVYFIFLCISWVIVKLILLMLFCLISSFITLQLVASNRRLRIAIATHTTHSFVRHYDHHFYSRCCRPEFSPFRPSADPSSTSSHNAQNSHLEGKPKGRTSNN